MRRPALVAFLVATLAPLTVTAIVAIPRLSRNLATPSEYVRLLEERHALTWMPPGPDWKVVLAGRPSCSAASAVVLGTSRVLEIDAEVLGIDGPVCNLGVGALTVDALHDIVRSLPAHEGVRRPFAYLGVDDFLFFDLGLSTSHVPPKSASAALWRAWRFAFWLTSLSQHTLREDLSPLLIGKTVEAFERQRRVFYADGHAFSPRYFAAKLAGQPHRSRAARLPTPPARTARVTARLEMARLATFQQILSTLLGKGYRVRVFWNPRVPAEIAWADGQNPTLTGEAVAVVGELVRRLGVDDYAPPRFDPLTFGCTERDYLDPTHVDADCQRRFFRVAFNSGDWPHAAYARRRFERKREVYQAALEQAAASDEVSRR